MSILSRGSLKREVIACQLAVNSGDAVVNTSHNTVREIFNHQEGHTMTLMGDSNTTNGD